MYLKLTAYYALKLYENGGSDEKARNIIMNTISVMVSNFEFSEKDFEALANGFKNILPPLIKKYESLANVKDDIPESLKSVLNLMKSRYHQVYKTRRAGVLKKSKGNFG